MADLGAACAGADLLIAATPTGGFRELLTRLRGLEVRQPLVWLCKGFEANTGLLPHQVLEDAWPGRNAVAVLSGPSFAQEVASGLPAALTLASSDLELARQLAKTLHDQRLRLYASNDVVGVELGGGLKNVMAIASGLSDGFGFGHNARAALVTRGLSELTRLGLKLGGRAETFMGLSGMGDLVLTCTGDLSRNRQLGQKMAAGMSLEGALQSLGHVAEGVSTALEADALARELGVDMPITRAVSAILRGECPAMDAVASLLARELRDEGN
jgi:glycerol-3-phosphate dehydrogenase (NAD(P)+)